MRSSIEGAIDCNALVCVPGIGALVSYLDAYWRERVHIQQLGLVHSVTSHPPTAPLSAWPHWRPRQGPYVAETYPVAVEENYIVVEV